MEQDSAHVAKVVEDGMVVVKEEVAVKEEVLVAEEASTSKVHESVASNESENNTCDLCRKKFVYESGLKVHKTRMHGAASQAPEFPSRWEMVVLKDYLRLGARRSRESFWTSCSVRLVMSGLQGSTITADQAAQLLGVSVGTLARRFMKEEKVEELAVKKEEVVEDAAGSENMRGVKRKVEEAWGPLEWVTPEVVTHLLTASLAAKDREVGEWEESPVLRPALAFYTDNVERVCGVDSPKKDKS